MSNTLELRTPNGAIINVTAHTYDDGRVGLVLNSNQVESIEIVRTVGTAASPSAPWPLVDNETTVFVLKPKAPAPQVEWVDLLDENGWRNDGATEIVVKMAKRKFGDALQVVEPNGDQPGRLRTTRDRWQEIMSFLQQQMELLSE